MKIKTDGQGISKGACAVLIACVFIMSAVPLAQSGIQQDEPATVLDVNTLERAEPVVMLGSAFPAYVTAQYSVDNLFVWAYRDGGWQQVVFQIDEANGTFMRKDYPTTSVAQQKNYYIADNGYLDNDDELCFMANETGDRVNRPIWAPGANKSIIRYEITVVDPLDTSKKGWAYLFYHDTPPAWTTVDYVSWTESTNYLDAYGYSIDYFDDDDKQVAFEDMRVKSTMGGTNTDMVDREKKALEVQVSIQPDRSEYSDSDRGIETYHAGLNNHPQFNHDYGIKDGPVRVLKHLIWCFGSANLFDYSDKMGFSGHLQIQYYSNMYIEEEYIIVQTTGAKSQFYYRAVDHTSSAGDMEYYNSQSGAGTINGVNGDDSVPTSLMLWDQVSSAQGSYFTRYEPGTFTGEPENPITKTTRWIDDSASPDTDCQRVGAEPGRYGEHGLYFDNPNTIYYWGKSRSFYTVYFLPADMPNVGQEYYDYSENPLVTNSPSPAAQNWHSDHYPPATNPGTVLVDGVASLEVNLSEAGNALLTATVDDSLQGNSNVISAQWTLGFASFPGMAMNAADGGFDSPTENVEATLDLSTFPAGTHDIYVYGTDALLNLNETSTEHATVTIIDDLAPATNPGTVLVDGSTSHTVLFSETAPVQLTATVNDTDRGFSDITSAAWTPQFADFPGTAMTAVDGALDHYLEPVEATLDLPNWDAGVYDVHVYGSDAVQQNTTSTEHATITITDDVAPMVTPLLNGQATYSMGVTDDPLLDLTALVDDAGLGGTTIGGANYTLGSQNWNSSTSMTPDDVLDTSTEGFTQVVDVTGWAPGTYQFYVYGRDAVPNCDIENAPHAVLVIINELAPEVHNVLVDGAPEVWVPLSARGTNVLTATLDSSNIGDYNIGGANYTIGMANWSSATLMDPVDVLDSQIENFTANVDVSGWIVGAYDLYVYGWDESNNNNVTSLEFATIYIYDDMAPIADTVQINGAEVYETDNAVAGTITLTAWVDDTLTGNSIIGGAEYTVGPENWPAAAMAPVNALDSPREQFAADLDISSWVSGVYYLYPYGWDAVPNHNTVAGEFATLIIHDVTAPAIGNVRINGTSIFSIDYANATTIDLTALLDDTGRGDSEIGGANYTLEFQDWASAVPMSTYNDEALADVPVTGTVTNDYTEVQETPDDGVYENITEVESTQSAEAVTNGIFDTDYSPWTLTRLQTGGTSGWDGTRTATADSSGSVSSYVYVNARNTVLSEESLWSQTFTATSSQVTVNGAYRAQVSSVGAQNFNPRSTIEIDVYDTGDTAWHTIYSTGPLTASTAWTDFGPDASYTPVGSVNEVRARILSEISTGGGATPTASAEGWVDDISILFQDTKTFLDHRWNFDMGSSPTFYVDASNPASSDNDFKFQYSTDSGTSWNDFPTNIQYAPGEVDVLKSSTIPLATYYDNFLVRVISVNPGPAADTFSMDRMWAEGQFNNNPETVHSAIDISAWQPGEYQLYVYGWDKSPQYNTTSNAHATLIITDNLAPELYNFLAEGQKHLVINLSAGFVNLTGTVDDSNTGNANIAWGGYAHEDANMTVGEYMDNDTALDSPVEAFSKMANISGLSHGMNRLYMYGADSVGMTNESKIENVTIDIIDDVAPATTDWSIRLNGASEAWVDPMVTTSVDISATIDDALHGYSNVTAAQWTAGQGNFQDNWMFPTDGAWDNYTEQVNGSIDISTWLPGTYYIYVYGTDELGNARTEISTYAILYLDNNGPAIEGPWAGPTLNDAIHNPYVFVSETSFVIKAYGDDRDRGNSVVTAAEYFVDTIGENGTGIPMENMGFRFDSAYEGAYDTIDCSAWVPGEFHEYHIHFLDAMGEWGDMGSVLVMMDGGPEFTINFTVGWNLISLPIVTPITNLEELLSDISWDRAFIYDPQSTYPWLSHGVGRPPGINDFDNVDTTMGIWVHATAAGQQTISGGSTGTTQIMLNAGWNLVGYPTLNNRTASDALAGTGADIIGVYQEASPYVQDITELSTVIMSPGNGYWVHVPADTIWTVDW